jgi:hypothetical protein
MKLKQNFVSILTKMSTYPSSQTRDPEAIRDTMLLLNFSTQQKEAI